MKPNTSFNHFHFYNKDEKSYEFILLSDQYLKKDEEPFLKNIDSTIHVHLREMSIMVEFFPGLKNQIFTTFLCLKHKINER